MSTIELLLDRQDRPQRSDSPGYFLRLANTAADVLTAQRLRDEVVRPGAGRTHGELEVEAFDDRCDHLIVWHRAGAGAVRAVATCRLFPPHSNDFEPRSAGLYADHDFGLMPFERLMDSTVELGKACVAPDHRSGAAAALLWAGALRYLHLTGYRYLIGCCPIELGDGGRTAAACWDLALAGHLAPAALRCRPRDPIAIGRLSRTTNPHVPALLRACLRLGAVVCGPPGYNDRLGSADFLLLLDVQAADRRHQRRPVAAG